MSTSSIVFTSVKVITTYLLCYHYLWPALCLYSKKEVGNLDALFLTAVFLVSLFDITLESVTYDHMAC